MIYHGSMTEFTPIESEFATSEDAAAFDWWFCAKVEGALSSAGLGIPQDQVTAGMHAIIDRHSPR
jgi:hypothetical protein